MKLFIFLSLLGYQSAVFAGPPVKIATCADRITIRPPHNGAGVYFSDDCQTAFVLPPLFGTIELQGLSATAAPSDCQELNSLAGARASISAQIEALFKNRRPAAPRSEPGSGLGGNGGGLSEDEPAAPVEPRPTPRDTTAELARLLADLNTLRQSEDHFVNDEGLVATVIYTLDHENMVAEYARLNPQIKSFVRMPIERAYLSFLPKTQSMRTERSALIYSGVAGVDQTAFEGESRETTPTNSVFFGSAMRGQVGLNIKAACQIMDPRTGKTPEKLPASRLEKYLTANITYAYALNVRRKYFARYKFQSLFERIQKSTEKGGFLSSRTINELIQRNDSSSWFEFRPENDDTRFPNEVLAQHLKAEMIDRVMSQIAVAQIPGAAAAPALLQPGPKGAEVAAQGLKKCPYVYCQVAGYVLDFISATFGSSEAMSKFLSTVGSETTETVDESKALRFIGTSSFKDIP